MTRREALAALLALPAVKSIGIADIKPNDVIVIESDRVLSVQEIRNLEDCMQQHWTGHEVVVLDPSLRLRIARETP